VAVGELDPVEPFFECGRPLWPVFSRPEHAGELVARVVHAGGQISFGEEVGDGPADGADEEVAARLVAERSRSRIDRVSARQRAAGRVRSAPTMTVTRL
jgi:hypothetical protein